MVSLFFSSLFFIIDKYIGQRRQFGPWLNLELLHHITPVSQTTCLVMKRHDSTAILFSAVSPFPSSAASPTRTVISWLQIVCVCMCLLYYFHTDPLALARTGKASARSKNVNRSKWRPLWREGPWWYTRRDWCWIGAFHAWFLFYHIVLVWE